MVRVEAAYQNNRDTSTDYHYEGEQLVRVGDVRLEYDPRGQLVATHQGGVRRVLDPK